MKIKPFIRYAAAAIAACAFIACSKEDLTLNSGHHNTTETHPFTITASFDPSAQTRITMEEGTEGALRVIGLKWKDGDIIHVLNSTDATNPYLFTTKSSDISEDGKTAVFTAPEGYTGTPAYAVHFGINEQYYLNPTSFSPFTYKYAINTSDLPDLYPLYARFDQETGQVSFSPLLALLKLNITLPETAQGELSNLIITSADGSDIFYVGNTNLTHSSAVRKDNFLTNTLPYRLPDSKTFSVIAGVPFSIYLPINPGEELNGKELEMNLQVGNQAYSTTFKGGTLKAGKCYPLSRPADKWNGGRIYEGGTGEKMNPYQIATAENLRSLAIAYRSGSQYSGKYFKLMTDIEGVETSEAEPWLPIGTTDGHFLGYFDGNGKTVSGTFHLSDKYGYSQGFFGYVSGGSISNLTVKGDIICKGRTTSVLYLGSIAGQTETELNSCHHVGNVTYENTDSIKTVYVGGIAGNANDLVTGCTQSGGVITGKSTKADNSIGGIVGRLSDSGLIHTSRNESDITVTIFYGSIGALVGFNQGTVYDCSSFPEGETGLTVLVNGMLLDPVKAIGNGSNDDKQNIQPCNEGH